MAIFKQDVSAAQGQVVIMAGKVTIAGSNGQVNGYSGKNIASGSTVSAGTYRVHFDDIFPTVVSGPFFVLEKSGSVLDRAVVLDRDEISSKGTFDFQLSGSQTGVRAPGTDCTVHFHVFVSREG